MIKSVSLNNAPKAPHNLDAYIMHTSSTLEVIHLCLQPGQHIPRHANSFDVVASLIKGEITLHLGAYDGKLTLYDVVEIEKNIERGFTNDGTSEARLIILKKL